MQDIRKLDALFAELEARYGIANLRLPPHGAVGLRLRDGSELFLEYEEARHTLYAYTKLTSLPSGEAARLKVCTAMLEWNFLDAGIGNGALSVNKDMVMCHVRFNVDNLQFDEFDRGLQALLGARVELTRRVEEAASADTPKAARSTRSTSTLLAALR